MMDETYLMECVKDSLCFVSRWGRHRLAPSCCAAPAPEYLPVPLCLSREAVLLEC